MGEFGPAVLAARGRAPIVPFFVRRETPGKFRIVFGSPIDAGDGSPAAQLDATQRTAEELERLIRTDPTQWNCFKPLWPSAAEQRRLEALAVEMAEQHGKAIRT